MRLEDAIRERMERDPEFAQIWIDEAPRRSFQQSLIAARLDAGMTQHELAEATGIGRATIARLETGETNPQVHTLQRLAMALGVQFEVSATGISVEPVPVHAD